MIGGHAAVQHDWQNLIQLKPPGGACVDNVRHVAAAAAGCGAVAVRNGGPIRSTGGRERQRVAGTRFNEAMAERMEIVLQLSEHSHGSGVGRLAPLSAAARLLRDQQLVFDQSPMIDRNPAG